MEKQKVKQDLLIAVMCVFLVLLIMLIAGCTFLHYKLMTEESMLKKDLPSSAIQAHCKETKIVLTLQPNQLASSEGEPALLPSRPPDLPPEDPVSHPLGAFLPNQKSGTFSVCHVYGRHSCESLHSDESGSLYSVEHFQCLYSSSRSESKESLDSIGSQDEELEINNESGSIVLYAIHDM
ncbi:uncharacterized protein LOC134409146 isoform X2 [Elgaria multicarinata webbii]